MLSSVALLIDTRVKRQTRFVCLAAAAAAASRGSAPLGLARLMHVRARGHVFGRNEMHTCAATAAKKMECALQRAASAIHYALMKPLAGTGELARARTPARAYVHDAVGHEALPHTRSERRYCQGRKSWRRY